MLHATSQAGTIEYTLMIRSKQDQPGNHMRCFNYGRGGQGVSTYISPQQQASVLAMTAGGTQGGHLDHAVCRESGAGSAKHTVMTLSRQSQFSNHARCSRHSRAG